MIASLVAVGVGIYLLVAFAMYVGQARLIFLPSATHSGSPTQVGLDYEPVWLTTTDGVRIHGWFVPAPTARHTILFLHGNAGNIGDRLQTLSTLHALGLNVLIIDYRGYGQSEGQPSEDGTYQDALAAWRYLTETRSIEPSRIIVHGRSLGGAVAVWLASQQNTGGLIVESSFTSLPALAGEIYWWLPVSALARVHYPSSERIARANCPVLIMHGTEDEIIPYAHGERLYALAAEPKRFLSLQGGHNDGFVLGGERYVETLREFIITVEQHR